jgi:glycosyltransferase involved in cell wall biosynthesis
MEELVEKSLRVCIISREYPPETGFGGIATFANHLAHGLVSLGHHITVITLAKNEPKSYTEDNIEIHRVKPYFDQHALNLIDWPMPYSKYVISTSAALWKKFIELHSKRSFDVVDTPELLAEGFYPAITKVAPLIIRLYTPHSKFIAEGLHNVTPSFDHQFVAMLERIAMIYADALTSPSKDLAQFVANDLCLPIERIKVIHNPIDSDFCSPDGKQIIGGEEDSMKVLFVGRLEARKGIYFLIEAWKEVVAAVPTAHLYVIGDDTQTATGQTSVLAELQKFINKNKLESSITFINRIPLTELPAYYRSADVCVVPSLYDNSPYTCLEAMSCGKAVIGTSSGGTAEYIIDGDSGVIIPAKDASSLSEAIVRLLKNDAERLRLGNNARTRVLTNFQKREIATLTVQLYIQAIEKFADRQSHNTQSSLYTRGPQEILNDMEYFASSFNEMLHQFSFQWSFSYRIKTWYRKLKSRPKLYSIKALLWLIDYLTFWLTDDERKNNSLHLALENLIIFKEKEKKSLPKNSFSATNSQPENVL